MLFDFWFLYPPKAQLLAAQSVAKQNNFFFFFSPVIFSFFFSVIFIRVRVSLLWESTVGQPGIEPAYN